MEHHGSEVSSDKEKYILLSGLEFFEDFRRSELDRLARYTRWSSCPARKILFRKGDFNPSMMVVRRGRVKVSIHSDDGKELVLALFREGEVFGEMSLLSGGPRIADAETIEVCELLVIDRRDFIPFLLDHPHASLRMIEVLTRRFRRTNKQLEDIAFRTGRSRLARWFVRLAQIMGKDVDHGTYVDLHLSQEQLGGMVGMTRESINKQLKEWRQDRLITYDSGYYTITNMEELIKLG